VQIIDKGKVIGMALKENIMHLIRFANNKNVIQDLRIFFNVCSVGQILPIKWCTKIQCENKTTSNI